MKFVRDFDKEFYVRERELVYITNAKQEEVINRFFLNEISYDEINIEFKHDKSFLLELVKNIGIIFKELDNNYKEDKEIILTAVKNNANVVHFLDEKILCDKDFVKQILMQNACCISRLPNEIAYDFENLSIIEEALIKYKFLYQEYFECLEKYQREIKLKEEMNKSIEISSTKRNKI